MSVAASLSAERHPALAGMGRWWGSVIILALVLVLTVAGGLPGALVGGVTAVVWLWLGTPFAIGAAVVGYVSVVPPEASPLFGATIAVGLALLVLGDVLGRGAPFGVRALAVIFPVSMAALVWAVTLAEWGVLWQVAGVVLLGIATGLYLLHRLTLVRAGLVTEED